MASYSISLSFHCTYFTPHIFIFHYPRNARHVHPFTTYLTLRSYLTLLVVGFRLQASLLVRRVHWFPCADDRVNVRSLGRITTRD